MVANGNVVMSSISAWLKRNVTCCICIERADKLVIYVQTGCCFRNYKGGMQEIELPHAISSTHELSDLVFLIYNETIPQSFRR